MLFDYDNDVAVNNSSDDNASRIRNFITNMTANCKGQERVSSLNRSQQDALLMCLNNIERNNGNSGHISLVQGPPGCGKTHFLVALMHVLLSRGHKLIVRHYFLVIILTDF